MLFIFLNKDRTKANESFNAITTVADVADVAAMTAGAYKHDRGNTPRLYLFFFLISIIFACFVVKM